LLSTSGIMKNSRSINVITTRMDKITQRGNNLGTGARKAATANNNAVSVSTITYLELIGA
jgi:hypothetical protein